MTDQDNLGATPSQSTTGNEPTARDHGTSAEARTQPAEEVLRAPEGRSGVIRVSSTQSRMRSVSFWCACAAIGVGVLATVIPLFWSAAALAPLGDLRLHSVSLVVGGLLTLSLGGQRESLVRIRRVIEGMGSELTRLEQLAFENRRQSVALQSVQLGHKDVKEEVIKLRQSVQQLAELAASPEPAKNMLKLAGTIDQQRAKLEALFKEQVGALRAVIAESSEQGLRSTRALGTTLSELEGTVAEQQQACQLALREGFDAASGQQDALKAELERTLALANAMEQGLREQQEQLERVMDTLVKTPGVVAAQVSASARELTERCETIAQIQAEREEEQTGALVEAIGRVERGLAPEFNALSERLARELDTHGQTFGERLAKLATAAEEQSRQTAQRLARMDAKYDERTSEQVLAVEQAIARAIAATDQVSDILTTNLERVTASLETTAQTQQTKLAQCLESTVDNAISRAIEATQAVNEELTSGLERVNASIETTTQTQQSRFAQCVERTVDNAISRAVEATQAVNEELTNGLQRVNACIEATAQTQQAKLAQCVERTVESAISRAVDATQAVNEELTNGLERVNASIETTAQTQQAKLAQCVERTVDNAISRAVEATQAVNEELTNGLERVNACIESTAQTQQIKLAQCVESTVTNATSRTVEATNAVGDALTESLEVLSATLEGTINSAAARAIETTNSAYSGLSTGLERVNTRLDSQPNGLSGTPDAALADVVEATLMASTEIDRCRELMDSRLTAHEAVLRDSLNQSGELIMSASLELGATAERLSGALAAATPLKSASSAPTARPVGEDGIAAALPSRPNSMEVRDA